MRLFLSLCISLVALSHTAYAGDADSAKQTPALTGEPDKIEEDGPPVPLQGQGQILPKKNIQSRGSNCSAERHWIELDAMANPKAQERINTFIRRKLTVGKPLTAKACYDYSNRVEYDNSAKITGIKNNAIGVETTIVFGGERGHPSILTACDVFNLKTGDRYSLDKYLTPAGKTYVANAICNSNTLKPLDDNDKKLYCSGYTALIAAINAHEGYERYCLTDKGIEARIKIDFTIEDTFLVPQENFLLPAELDISSRP